MGAVVGLMVNRKVGEAPVFSISIGRLLFTGSTSAQPSDCGVRVVYRRVTPICAGCIRSTSNRHASVFLRVLRQQDLLISVVFVVAVISETAGKVL